MDARRREDGLRIAVVLSLLLGLGSARAMEPLLADFLRDSARASDEEFSALIDRVNPYQLPLAALSINAEERESGAFDDAYEALARWHFWMVRELDPEGRGLWQLRRLGAVDSPERSGRESAVIAALQRLQLRALGEMATRRGRMVDALAWAREERLVERSMMLRLYDPVAGAYVDVDSFGARVPDGADLQSLIAVGLGAPGLRAATAELADRVLAARDLDDAALRDALVLRLDPLGGWWQRPGSAEMGAQSASFFLRRGLGLMRAQRHREAVDAALRVYGVAGRDVAPRLGPLTLTLDEQGLRPLAFAHSEAALGYLARAGLVHRDVAADFQRRIEELRADPSLRDSLATPLLRALSDWKGRELQPQAQTFLRGGEERLPEPNGVGVGAFRYIESDRKLWTAQALDVLTADLLGLYLSSQHASVYEATVEPTAVATATRPELRLRRLASTAQETWPGADWRAAWTDGRHIRPSQPIHFSNGGADEFVAALPAPPDEKGLWWLVLTGPHGLPREAAGVSVVDPLLAEVVADGAPAPDGTQRLRVQLHNYTRSRLVGRMELELPQNWEATPSHSTPFQLEPGRSSVSHIQVTPDEFAQAGQYPTRVRFVANGRVLQEQRLELAIPYQWITLGGFAAAKMDPLKSRTPGDAPLDTAGRYGTLGGKRGWEHLQRESISPGGWISLAEEGAPRGLYFARTVLSSESREILVQFECTGIAELRLNDARLLEASALDGFVRVETRLDFGANHLQVKMLAGGETPGRFRVSLRDIEGGPLLALENRLERLLDGYAYVRGAGAHGGEDLDEGDRYVLVPIVYRTSNAASVAVVGSFNGWSPSATPMIDQGDGRWRAEIRLPLGRFEYKLAIDGLRWIADPANPVAVPDGFGGRNSVLILE